MSPSGNKGALIAYIAMLVVVSRAKLCQVGIGSDTAWHAAHHQRRLSGRAGRAEHAAVRLDARVVAHRAHLRQRLRRMQGCKLGVQ